jgi:molybdopterin molybdotransferase
MKTIAEALAETMELFAPLPSEEVCEIDRFVAEPVVAALELPPFDASLVDGYAVHTSECVTRTALRVEGESRAGGPLPPPLRERTTMRIFTGAPIPVGADAVVMQEVVTRDADLARFERAVSLGDGIRRRASDVAVGDVLLARGAAIDAGAIGSLATQGLARCVVHRRPRVAIITNGDELIAPGDPSRDGAIYDSNGPMLAALVTAAGAIVVSITRAQDRVEEIVVALERALASADVVLTAGGVSVGDHDLVHVAFERLAIERRLWKVRVKPGKPLAVSVKNGVPVIGLPGNPVSAWVGFEVFVRPGLRRMLGDPRPHRRVAQVVLGRALRATKDRTELARAHLDDDGVAWPHDRQGSSAITSVTHVDALLVLPEREGEIASGERVRALILDRRGSDQPAFA